MDASALSELIKTKVASLIQEHLKPVVSELAAQQQILQTHSALLRYNHNVNDYQMGRLENLRDLEQSINFKVAGALAFDPWQHPTMGTNLREPIPADRRLIPRFTPESKTPVERAAESAELIAQAGVSARRLGVPLTLHDFPRDPAIHGGGEDEDPMHAAVPLFGLRAPRWRAKEGLPPDTEPGTATYNGVAALPKGKKGKRLYKKRAQKMKPKWKSFEAATAPRGPPSTSSSFADKLFELLDGPALAGPSGSSGTSATGSEASTSGITLMPRSPGQETFTSSSTFALVQLANTSLSTIAPALALSEPTTSSTFEQSIASTSTANLTSIAHAASSERTNQSDSQENEKIRIVTPTAPSFTSTTLPPAPTPPSLKRTRKDAELYDDDDDDDDNGAVPPTKTNPEPQPQPHIKQEEPEEPEHHQPRRQHKRRRRSSAPSPSPSLSLAIGRGSIPGQLRRSTRVARAHAQAHANANGHATAAPAPAPATRKRQNGKRASAKSRS